MKFKSIKREKPHKSEDSYAIALASLFDTLKDANFSEKNNVLHVRKLFQARVYSVMAYNNFLHEADAIKYIMENDNNIKSRLEINNTIVVDEKLDQLYLVHNHLEN